MKKSFFNQLNPQQKRAVQSQQAVVVVQAGPGTGKTHTLVAKLINLIEGGVEPRKIAALTFTNKAAAGMKARVEAYFGRGKHANQQESGSFPMVATFHSFALQELEIDSQCLVTEFQQRRLVSQLIEQADSTIKAKDVLLLISQEKNKIGSGGQPPIVPRVTRDIIENYQQTLADLNKLDFDDLLIKLHEQSLLPDSTFPYCFLLVDEFQDLNQLQHQLIFNWRHDLQQLFVIGDKQQAIYGFRGTDSSGFAKLTDEVSDCEKITLIKNYRNPQQVIAAASKLFPNLVNLQSVSNRLGQVQLVSTLNQFSEAEWIVADINKRVGGTDMNAASRYHQQQDVDLSQFAVLYRSHYLSQVIENKLQQRGVPFQRVGRQSLFAQPVIRLILDFLKLGLKDKNSVSERKQVWLRILSNPWLNISLSELTIIEQELKKLRENKNYLLAVFESDGQNNLTDLVSGQAAARLRLLAQIASFVDKNTNLALDDLVEGVVQLLRSFQPFTKLQLKEYHQLKSRLLSFKKDSQPLDSLLGYVKSIEDLDYYDDQADKVSLLTMHAAKGLEFTWVYLIGFEQGLIPLSRKKSQPGRQILSRREQLLEEKRLFYVALTRAKKGVFLMKTKFRYKKETKQSQFEKIISQQIEQMQDKKLRTYLQKKENEELAKGQSSLF